MNQAYIQALIGRGYYPDMADRQNVLMRKQGADCYIVMMGNYIVSVEDILRRRAELDRLYYEQGYQHVYHLLVLFHRDALFLEEQLEAVNRIPNTWLYAEDQHRVFAYENQPMDFDGLSGLLESVHPASSGDGSLRSGQSLRRKSGYFSREHFPHVTVTIVTINVLVFLLSYALGKHDASVEQGALWGYPIQEYGQWYRILTSMFIHLDFTHIFNNMVGLLILGEVIETAIGHWKYLGLYMGSGILSNLVCLWSGYYYNRLSVGASGAIYGLTGAILALRIFFREKVPGLSLGWMIWMVVFSVVESFTTEGVNNIGHISGLITGFLLIFLASIYRKLYKFNWNK